jgi:hypothetical protein
MLLAGGVTVVGPGGRGGGAEVQAASVASVATASHCAARWQQGVPRALAVIDCMVGR